MRIRTFILLTMMGLPLLGMENGCGEKRGTLLDDPESESSNEQSESITQEAALMGSLMEVNGTPVDDMELASDAAESATTEFGEGCVSSAIAANVVTYTFNNCTGPWGFVVVAGDIVATYTLMQNGDIQAVGVGDELTINDNATEFDSTVIRSVEGAKRTLRVTTNWSGETKNGQPTSRSGNYVAVLDYENECVAADGTWMTEVGAIAWTTIVDGFNVCRGECPGAGGSIAFVGKNKTTTVSYDGTDEASWENTDDQSGTLDLRCGS